MAQLPDVSETAVANMALSLLQAQPLINLAADTHKEARAMQKWFAPVRDALLRRYPWNFAEERAALPALTAKPPWGDGNYYLQPADCLRVLRVDKAGPKDWKVVSGRRILSCKGPPLNIVYTKRITDTQAWDSLFVQAMALALAERAGGEIARDRRIPADKAAEVREALAEAFPADAQEGSADSDAEPDDAYTWIRAYD